MNNLTNTLNKIVDILEKQQKQIDKIENELMTLKLSITMKDIKKDEDIERFSSTRKRKNSM